MSTLASAYIPALFLLCKLVFVRGLRSVVAKGKIERHACQLPDPSHVLYPQYTRGVTFPFPPQATTVRYLDLCHKGIRTIPSHGTRMISCRLSHPRFSDALAMRCHGFGKESKWVAMGSRDQAHDGEHGNKKKEK